MILQGLFVAVEQLLKRIPELWWNFFPFHRFDGTFLNNAHTFATFVLFLGDFDAVGKVGQLQLCILQESLVAASVVLRHNPINYYLNDGSHPLTNGEKSKLLIVKRVFASAKHHDTSLPARCEEVLDNERLQIFEANFSSPVAINNSASIQKFTARSSQCRLQLAGTACSWLGSSRTAT